MYSRYSPPPLLMPVSYTHLDVYKRQVEVVPEDIGRAITNICNNAFYAVMEKAKTSPLNYQPQVWTTTTKEQNKLNIIVRDNGPGIPEKYLDKIFQPFFTTKPTGTGIGLGLSMAYDIIKAHGGELRVNSTEGEFTEFIVTLLCN